MTLLLLLGVSARTPGKARLAGGMSVISAGHQGAVVSLRAAPSTDTGFGGDGTFGDGYFGGGGEGAAPLGAGAAALAGVVLGSGSVEVAPLRGGVLVLPAIAFDGGRVE